MKFPYRFIGMFRTLACLTCCAFAAQIASAQSGNNLLDRVELSGYLAIENRTFFRSPEFEGSRRHSGIISFVAQPEFYTEWNDGDDAFLFVPFLRVDPTDPERTHFDIRELNYLHVGKNWEARIGIARVFWGVTESQHLVDIINQTDAVEDVDEEDKLGQPMLHFSWFRDLGNFELFILPGSRERTFPGRLGRLRGPLDVAEDYARYESTRDNWHVDVAGRWSHTLGNWDVALSHFYGTARDPRFSPGFVGDHRSPKLIPFYDIIHQTGLELQYTGDSLLLKLEAIGRDGQGSYRAAVVGGFEYTFVGVMQTAADLGILGELHLADDAQVAPTTPFDRDIFVGLRLALNDTQSTDLLAGVIVDLAHGSTLWSLEASRRLGDRWRVEFDLRLFMDLENTDPLRSVARDDFFQLRIARYF